MPWHLLNHCQKVDGELQLRQFVDTVHERGTFELVASCEGLQSCLGCLGKLVLTGSYG